MLELDLMVMFTKAYAMSFDEYMMYVMIRKELKLR